MKTIPEGIHMSYKEIALKLGVSERTVRDTEKRALKKIFMMQEFQKVKP